MLLRRIEKEIDRFFGTEKKKVLLITGARQVGKTYIIRECARKHFESVVEINFLENKNARGLFADFTDSRDILLRLSALTDKPLIKGQTLIFFDEVQECRDLVTAVKFLVEEGSYRYVMSGSLLGVELKDIRSMPVGYMDIMEMFPLNFMEFCMANRVSDGVLGLLKDCFDRVIPVDSLIHEKMMELFRLYLITGGMPDVVNTYLETNNLKEVANVQKNIILLYKKDISKYDPQNKLYLEEIFDLIPGELNSKNKRFILKSLNENFKFSRYEHSFVWLKDAGVAHPVFCAAQPSVPLMLSRSTNLFKLFLSDVGLLAAMYMDGLQIRILSGEKDINFGAVYENAVAQELKAHGFDLYYFNSKKQGELDFLIEYEGDVLPIEVKSGKAYSRHIALDNVINNELYQIPRAFIFSNENVRREGKKIYYPIYMVGFLNRENSLPPQIYKPDFSILTE
jgi:hypothetical protein